MDHRINKILNIITSKALFKFSIKCLHQYMDIKPGSNYVFSPYNIYEALFLVYLTSSGAVEQKLKHILYLTEVSKYVLIGTINFDKHFSTFTNYMAASTSEPLQLKTNMLPYEYENESICWIKESKFPADPKAMKEIFRNGFETFDNNVKVNVNNINGKIRSQTTNHFNDLVKLKTIEDMDIVLSTVLRFNIRKFQESMTRQSNSQIKLPVSDKRKCKTHFSLGLSTFILEFPYQNCKSSLYLLVPGSFQPESQSVKINFDTTKLFELIDQLSTDEGRSIFFYLLERNLESNVEELLSWPTFELENNLKFRELLQALGVGQLLTSDAINLDTFFSEYEQSVQYGNVLHRVHVKVTEKDTVAGAISLFTNQRLFPTLKQMKVDSDYPFVWLIYDKEYGDILFIGACRKADPLDESLIEVKFKLHSKSEADLSNGY